LWQVPRNLIISGLDETFTATVTFDTKQLWGKINATCKIKLEYPLIHRGGGEGGEYPPPIDGGFPQNPRQ
jgi:hypothetical protein